MMQLSATDVALLACHTYDRRRIKETADRLFGALDFAVRPGCRVLLKPNLIAADPGGLATTHPEVVAAVAEWFLDHAAVVTVGDSPAFGSARRVMAATGMAAALKGLPVRICDFKRPRQVSLASGVRVGIEAEVLTSELVVNLPRLKAHGQFLLTMAVKNLFGAVVGIRKPLLHARFGDVGQRFEEILVDLLAVLPDGVSVLDGIVGMQKSGPLHGDPCPVGVLAASNNPVALDTAMIMLLGCDPQRLPLWRECKRRGLEGADAASLRYPLASPGDLPAPAFALPDGLKPVSFHPGRLLVGGMKRLFAAVR